MKIIIPEIPPSLNKYAGRLNGWEYRAEKQRWIGLMRAYCKKQKPISHTPSARPGQLQWQDADGRSDRPRRDRRRQF